MVVTSTLFSFIPFITRYKFDGPTNETIVFLFAMRVLAAEEGAFLYFFETSFADSRSFLHYSTSSNNSKSGISVVSWICMVPSLRCGEAEIELVYSVFIAVVPVVSVTVTCVLCVSIKQRVLWYESVQFFNGDSDVTYQQCQIFKSATNTRDFCIIQLQCIRVFNLSNAYTIQRTAMCVIHQWSTVNAHVFSVRCVFFRHVWIHRVQ